MRGTPLSIALGMSLLAYACGGGGGDTGPVTEAEAEAPCTQICEKNLACGSTSTLAECTADCVDDVSGWVREDALDQLADCLSGLTCEADEGQCLAMLEPLDAHREWSAQCRAELAACPDIDVERDCSIEPSSGDAGLFLLIAPAIMDEITACLDSGDCTAKITCVQSVFEKYDIDL